MMSLRALLVTPNQPPPEEPTTPEEWQLVVDAAAGFRCIAECRMYGLMKGGPEIDVQNCVHFMARGAELGYHATLTMRRHSGRAIGPLFAEVGFRLRILDDDGRLGGVILPPRKVPLQVLRRTLEASGNKRRSLAIPQDESWGRGPGFGSRGQVSGRVVGRRSLRASQPL